MKVLRDTITGKISGYPRRDDEPVVGLDPRYQVLTVVSNPPPDYNQETHDIEKITTIDVDNSLFVHGWKINQKTVRSAEEIALERAQKKTEFYLQMLHKINAENDLVGFTSEQVVACMQLLMPVKTLLEVGAVSTALGLLQQIEPTTEYTAERKAAHVAILQEFLGSL